MEPFIRGLKLKDYPLNSAIIILNMNPYIAFSLYILSVHALPGAKKKKKTFSLKCSVHDEN